MKNKEQQIKDKSRVSNFGEVLTSKREVLDMLNDSLGALIFDKSSDESIDRKCKLCLDGELSLIRRLNKVYTFYQLIHLNFCQILMHLNCRLTYLKLLF